MVARYQLGNTENTIELKKGNIKVVSASENDLELILAWRSHPEIFRFFRQQKGPLTWEEHVNFWKMRKNREDLIIKYQNDGKWRKVGTINFSKLDSKLPEVGILIGELTLHGKGVGLRALLLGLKLLKEQRYERVFAEINVKNAASTKLFKKAGFKLQDQDQSQEWQRFVVYL